MKRYMILLLAVALVFALAIPVNAARTAEEWELEQLNRWLGGVTGQGAVTWGNTTPISVTMSSSVAETDGTNTMAIASQVITLVGQASAVAGTQPMMNVTVINASATTAMTGTITWSSGDLLTIETNLGSAQSKTTDCTGITLTACVTAANAFTWTATNTDTSVAAGSSLPDSTYTDYYEPEAAADLAATAFTVAVSSSKVITPIAMGDGTLYDTAALDVSSQTIDYFETTLEAMYGGDYLVVTVADGLDTDLANGTDDIADKGATDIEAANPLPFTAGNPMLDRLEEDRYTSLGMCSYMVDVGTTGFIEVYDGSTKIWKQVLVDGATTYTTVDFRDSLSATGSNNLTFRIQGSDTVTAGEIYCLGRTD